MRPVAPEPSPRRSTRLKCTCGRPARRRRPSHCQRHAPVRGGWHPARWMVISAMKPSVSKPKSDSTSCYEGRKKGSGTPKSMPKIVQSAEPHLLFTAAQGMAGLFRRRIPAHSQKLGRLRLAGRSAAGVRGIEQTPVQSRTVRRGISPCFDPGWRIALGFRPAARPSGTATDGRCGCPGSFLDITARRSKRKKPCALELRFRRLVETANVVPWEMDFTAGLVTASRRRWCAFGLSGRRLVRACSGSTACTRPIAIGC